MKENRVYQRVVIRELDAAISDGVGFYSGEIADISRYGLCMVDLPKQLKDTKKIMSMVVSGGGKYFKMHVMPKWTSEHDSRKMVGFEIVDTSWDWTEFVLSRESQSGKAWELVNH